MPKLEFTGLRVLVAEDNPHMRKLLFTLLSGLGLRSIAMAEDGIDAYEAFKRQAPDIMLVDWQMPIMNGAELTRLIRNGPEPSCFVPIIAVTAFSEKRHVLAARDCGVTEILCKPVSAKGIYLRIVNCILNQRNFVRTRGFFGPDRRRFQNPHYTGAERRGGKSDDKYDLDPSDEVTQAAPSERKADSVISSMVARTAGADSGSSSSRKGNAE
ncbi:response regulator [Stappia sp. F7233]|uniref:Response regulator n=1 Tax=Stappia albiluteola TaxID=2758565 RepID=A0A839AEX7_9HYPH|nr:response regulator [Stappia albiluteola]